MAPCPQEENRGKGSYHAYLEEGVRHEEGILVREVNTCSPSYPGDYAFSLRVSKDIYLVKVNCVEGILMLLIMEFWRTRFGVHF